MTGLVSVARPATLAVVIPTFNRHTLLTRCVRSVTDDVMNDAGLSSRLKVIVVDDGSVSITARAALDGLEKDIPADILTVIRLPENSGGAAVPRNAALELVKSDYVFFVDSDDYLGEFAIRKLLHLLDEHQPHYIYVNSINVGKRSDASNAIIASYEERDRIHALRSLVVRRVFSAALIREYGLRFDEFLKSGQDLLFAFQFLLLARSFGFAGNYAYYHLVEHKIENEAGHLSRRTTPTGISAELRTAYLVHTFREGLRSLMSSGLPIDECRTIAGRILFPRIAIKLKKRLALLQDDSIRLKQFEEFSEAVKAMVGQLDNVSQVPSEMTVMIDAVLGGDVDRFIHGDE